MTTVAPDGGFWGWMAVFACFMGNLIGDGVMYRSGEGEIVQIVAMMDSRCDLTSYWTLLTHSSMRHFSFGVFLPKFKEHFQCGSGEISTIGSIQMGVCFGAGSIL